MRYYIWTAGCQMNKADSLHVENALRQAGYAPAAREEEADLVVLNTCSVRQKAEDRAYSKLGELAKLKARRPEMIVVLMGCMVGGNNVRHLRQKWPVIDYFVRPGAVEELMGMVPKPALQKGEGCTPLPPVHPGPTAYVNVIMGCNKTCTYCIVPFRRGRERSRPIPEVRAEVEELVAGGTREVTLLGQNVDTYGHDLTPPTDLAALVEALHPIPGLWRIRFLTSHPSDMSDRIIEAVARLPKACKHFNLPVQHGDDEILRSMRRGYTAAEYAALVEKIRRRIPEVSFATDVIVGYPGETEAQFMNTYRLLEDLRLDKVHVAAYSPRPGTYAARFLKDDVPRQEKLRRLHKIEELQERISAEIHAALVGREVDVLVEEYSRGQWKGRTDTNKLVFFRDTSRDWRGRMARVRIEAASPWALRGEVVADVSPEEVPAAPPAVAKPR